MRAKLGGRARAGAGLALVVSVTVLAAACSSNPPTPVSTAFAGAAAPSGSWPYPNGDLANTRNAPDAAISAANVSGLREAWAFKLTGTPAAGVAKLGALTAPPVVQGGVV